MAIAKLPAREWSTDKSQREEWYEEAVQLEYGPDDLLLAMFLEQLTLMKAIKTEELYKELGQEALVEEIVHCINNEASEMAAHFLVKTKPWKKVEEIDVDALVEESIDVLHFLLEFWILMGLSPADVQSIYSNKNSINRLRVHQKLEAAK